MSVLELMKSEKMPEEQLIEKEAVEEVITDTLNVVNLQPEEPEEPGKTAKIQI